MNNILDDYLAEENQQIPDDHRAILSTRLVHYIVDHVVLFILYYLIDHNFFRFKEIFDVLDLLIYGADAYISEPELIAEIIFGFFIYTMYFTLFESVTSRTPGKFITKSYVVASNGTKAGVAAIFGRSCARLIPLEPLSILNKEVLAWHDTWPKVIVVDARKTPMRKG